SLAFTIHLTLLGEAGLRRLARINHANAVGLAGRLAKVPGVTLLNEMFFNEFTIRVPGDAARVVEQLAGRGVLGGVPYSRLAPAGRDRPALRGGAGGGLKPERGAAAAGEALQGGLWGGGRAGASPPPPGGGEGWDSGRRKGGGREPGGGGVSASL